MKIQKKWLWMLAPVAVVLLLIVVAAVGGGSSSQPVNTQIEDPVEYTETKKEPVQTSAPQANTTSSAEQALEAIVGWMPVMVALTVAASVLSSFVGAGTRKRR